MASQTTRLAVSIANECTEITYENQMKMCKLPLENNFEFSEASANTVRRYSYGPPNPPGSDRSKTVLLMGGTGSGKTTWINAMINYELGVEWPILSALDSSTRFSKEGHKLTVKPKMSLFTTFTTEMDFKFHFR
jgi:GTPase SAR1 family protein